MTQGDVIKPVVFDGDEYFLVARVHESGHLFWIERPRGQLWLHLNEVIDKACIGLDHDREIVAATWDDPSAILRHLARASGWFEFTGREIHYPRHEINEVWRLSCECLDALYPLDVGAVLKKVFRQADKPAAASVSKPVGLLQMASQALSRLKLLGFSALVILRPDPESECCVVRSILALASAEPLRRHARWLEAGFGFCDRLVFHVDLEAGESELSAALFGSGFRTAQVLRIPVSGERNCEFVLLSTGSVRDSSGHAAVHEIMSDWPVWRRALKREFCSLSAREVDALKAVAAGLNGVQAAEMLGCVERTFRLHIDNAKKKLSAATAAEAVFKAQLLCAF